MERDRKRMWNGVGGERKDGKRRDDLPLVTSWIEEKGGGGCWMRSERREGEGGSVVMVMRSSLC